MTRAAQACGHAVGLQPGAGLQARMMRVLRRVAYL